MKTIFKYLFLIWALTATPLAQAQAVTLSQMGISKTFVSRLLNVTDEVANWPVKPSQAALIAQDAYPGSIVLGVRLLPSGEYAVTLKTGGSVQKVLVDATSGRLG